METTNVFDFIGGPQGQWQVKSIRPVIGETLQPITHLHIAPGNLTNTSPGIWNLKGFTSNVRYAEKQEREQLRAVQADLGRPTATLAALIPIKKTEAWWNLAQDERRQIFETSSRHTAIGLQYLPAIARKLYHCRDIGQPFDFLTWFEYAPEAAADFETLVQTLRQTEEWMYVMREVDIRLERV